MWSIPKLGVGAWCRREVSEAKEAAIEAYWFVRRHNWKTTTRKAFARRYWGWWLLLVIIITLSTVLSAYHNQIANSIQPYRHSIETSGWAWIIPFILLIVVSFPPLFGHELILLVCGLIWGIFRGFIIACAGTFFGELATYFAFKYFFRTRAQRIEEENVLYACIAKLMRDGGLPMLVLVRFSAMPGHVVTAMQSCIGISVWLYAVACFLTLPKQFCLVYLGKIFGDTAIQAPPGSKPDWNMPGEPGEPLQDYYKSKHRRISLIVFAVTTFATIIAAYLVWIRARRIRPTVLAEMEARRQAKLVLAERGSTIAEEEVQWKPPKFELGSFPRPRSGTLLTSSSLNSPSLPHLPYRDDTPKVVELDLDKTDGEPDYFSSTLLHRRRESAPGYLDTPQTVFETPEIQPCP